MIQVTCSSSDGSSESRSFKTLKGAIRYATDCAGKRPEISDNFNYAIDRYGVNKITANIPVSTLFPETADPEPWRDPTKGSSWHLDGVSMPKKRFILLDNGGKTTDRYTIFSTKATGYVGHKSVQYAGFNEHPYHPQGFGQHGEISPSQFDAHRRERFRALGKQISLDALPTDAQKFAKSFMDSVLEEDGE